jgi:serine/threonine protein kinase
MNNCKIKDNKLIKPCSKKQNSTRSKKCYKNKCYSPVESIKTGVNGHVNILENGLIIKWNKIPIKNKKDIKKIISEIRRQILASFYKISPIIHEFYLHNGYVYIIMENLLYKDYKPLAKLSRYTIRRHKKYICDGLKEKINKLHEIGIVHNDIHGNNVFYNKKTRDIIIIDYGMSEIIRNENQIINDVNMLYDIINIINRY